jgi:hypothetical protein
MRQLIDRVPRIWRARLRTLLLAVIVASAAIIFIRPGEERRAQPAAMPTLASVAPARATVSKPARPGVAVTSVASGDWSDPRVWRGGRVPGASNPVTVSTGTNVSVDASGTRAAGVEVEAGASLGFSPERTATLETSRNVVVKGSLVMKPEDPSIRHTLRFVGVSESAFVGGGMDPIASDVGLWVVGVGRLDLAGSPKSGWTRAAGTFDRGATTLRLEAVPRGWRPGDEISIAPTEPPTVGEAFSTDFELRRLTEVSGGDLTIDSGLSRVHPMVNGSWRAEVMNLTRNVMIEGTPTGRSHIFIRSSVPQSILYTAVRYMGPRQPSTDNDGAETFVTGRYGIHFHVSNDGSRGSLVQGAVVRDTGAHAYVAHSSHGVTFRDDISYDTYTDAYWWDASSDNGTDGPETNDTLYDHDIAALVRADGGEGYRMAGFNLLQGLRNEVRDSVAVGVQGWIDNPRALAAGFVWPESFGVNNHGVWTFARGNVAHNNAANGIFNWQNDGLPHVINDFVAYHNGRFGISQGAYVNEFNLFNLNLYGNAGGAIMTLAASGFRDDGEAPVPEERLRFEGVVMDGGGLSDYLVVAEDHIANGTEQPVLFHDVTMRGFRKAAITMRPAEANAAYALDFVDAKLAGNEFYFVDQSSEDTLPPSDYVRVQNGSEAYQVNTNASGEGDPVRIWNARKQVISPFFDSTPDGTPPQVGFASPTGGDRVSGVVPVGVLVFDNVGVTKVEFLVDGVVKGSDTTSPFSFRWDTAGLADGSGHRLQIKAYDAAGNANQSVIQTVFVESGAPAADPDALGGHDHSHQP